MSSSYGEDNQAFWDDLESKLRDQFNLDVEDEFWQADWFVTAITVARDMGYSRGYQEGVNDLGRAEAWAEREGWRS